MSMCVSVFNSFGYITRIGITGSYGNSMLLDFFFFGETAILYFLAPYHFKFPLAMQKGSNFSTSSLSWLPSFLSSFFLLPFFLSSSLPSSLSFFFLHSFLPFFPSFKIFPSIGYRGESCFLSRRITGMFVCSQERFRRPGS